MAYVHAPTAGFAQRRAGILDMLVHWMSVARQRRELAELDDIRLDDLGLTRANVKAELARTFWDAPAHWRR